MTSRSRSAGRVRRGRPQAVRLSRSAYDHPGGLIVLVLVLVAVLATVQPASGSTPISDGQASAGDLLVGPAIEDSAAGHDTKPAVQASTRARSTALFDLAAAQYGVSPDVLDALHQVESTAASDGCLRNRQGSDAVGPFQFMPATFRTYGVDADGNGHADICGFADSLFSAARYLRALGADDDPSSHVTRRALTWYGTDVEGVIALASRPLLASADGVRGRLE
jgi:membrane-bound lytic murein transglycosylase B